ncbi:MAG: aminoacetone oxidase family FAD-binding enzyme [Candidatus Hydrogenedens sp.]|nr:aminoacetone oxidase family FAD-binding enzyme [Candidatus Hydrogenedens sp.]
MNPYATAADVIVLGAGAAGLMCAIEAGKRGRRVVLLEHNESVGEKIRISGGGRCNFTNLNAEPARYLSENPRFCHSAFARYTPADFIALVEQHGIAYHEKKLGQLFCDDSSRQIIAMLLEECARAKVDIRTGCTVLEVRKGDAYLVETSEGTFRAPALVVATGGLSIPKLGATGIAYEIAEQFGVNVVPCAPALVPLTLTPLEHAQLADLTGISFPAVVSVGKTAFEENALITHRGLSGPAILQISSYWHEGEAITIDLYPGGNAEELLFATKRDAPRTTPRAFLNASLSARLAERLCLRNHWTRPLGETPDAELRAMARKLQAWRIPIQATEGYPKAEVTRGGIDTRALSPKTMEARDVPGLFFIGECVDVTGWLGGYNFQWAWASGAAAGRAL